MDLLFSRYTSPFLIIDLMLSNNCFEKFIDELYNTVSEEKLWDFYLHKIFGVSFEQFKNDSTTSINNSKITEADIETTITKSFDIIKNFKL